MFFFGIPNFLAILLNFFLISGLASGVWAVGKGTVTVVSCASVTDVPISGVESPQGWRNGWHWWVLRQKSWWWEFSVSNLTFCGWDISSSSHHQARDIAHGEHLSPEEERPPRIRVRESLCLQPSFFLLSPHPLGECQHENTLPKSPTTKNGFLESSLMRWTTI